jgi:hypothetical protein
MLTPRIWTTNLQVEGPLYAPISQVSDITIVGNVIHDLGQGFEVASMDSYCTSTGVIYPCLTSARTLVRGNLVYNVDLTGSENWGVQVDTPHELTIDHNTIVSAGVALFVDTYPTINTWFTNNIIAKT